MQIFQYIPVFASALVAQASGKDFGPKLELTFGKMVGESERLQVKMDLAATAEPKFQTDFFRTQGNMNASEVDLIKRMVDYSGAAYCPDLSLKSWSCQHCKNKASVEFIAVLNEERTGAHGYVALDHGMQSIVVSFKGSADPRNFLLDFNYGLFDYAVRDGTQGIKVHAGFLTYTELMSLEMLPVVSDLLKKYNYTVTLTGHSVGGAVATLSSIYMNDNLHVPWSRINLVTFGEPRIGNAAFARWFNTKNAGHLRVTNNRDMIVHLPLNDAGYFHRKREIFLKDGAMYRCTSENLEDDSCANSMVPFLNILDHINYLGITMGFGC